MLNINLIIRKNIILIFLFGLNSMDHKLTSFV